MHRAPFLLAGVGVLLAVLELAVVVPSERLVVVVAEGVPWRVCTALLVKLRVISEN
jgi:hypothetical protein